eukprot:763778-Hanusia_phi.AAC.12
MALETAVDGLTSWVCSTDERWALLDSGMSSFTPASGTTRSKLSQSCGPGTSRSLQFEKLQEVIDAYPHLSVAARAALLESPWTKGNKRDENHMLGSARKRAGKLVASRALQFDTPKKLNSTQERIPLSVMDGNKDSSPNLKLEKRSVEDRSLSQVFDIGKRKRLSYSSKSERIGDENIRQTLLKSYESSSECGHEDSTGSKEAESKSDTKNGKVLIKHTMEPSLDAALLVQESESAPQTSEPPAMTIDELLSIAQPSESQGEMELEQCNVEEMAGNDALVKSSNCGPSMDQIRADIQQEYSLLVAHVLETIKFDVLEHFADTVQSVDADHSRDEEDADAIKNMGLDQSSAASAKLSVTEEKQDIVDAQLILPCNELEKHEGMSTLQQDFDDMKLDFNKLKEAINQIQLEKLSLQNRLQDLEIQVSKSQNTMKAPEEQIRSLESRLKELELSNASQDDSNSCVNCTIS